MHRIELLPAKEQTRIKKKKNTNNQILSFKEQSLSFESARPIELSILKMKGPKGNNATPKGNETELLFNFDLKNKQKCNN